MPQHRRAVSLHVTTQTDSLFVLANNEWLNPCIPSPSVRMSTQKYQILSLSNHNRNTIKVDQHEKQMVFSLWGIEATSFCIKAQKKGKWIVWIWSFRSSKYFPALCGSFLMFRIFLLAMSSSQSVTICNKSGDPVAFFMPIIPIGSEASLMRLVFASLACYLLKFTMFILVINFEN